MTALKMPGALLCASLSLSACSPIDALGAFTGSGVNTAAAVDLQAGKNNADTSVGDSTVVDQRVTRPKARDIEQSTGDTKLRTERIHTVRIEEKDSSWLILALALAAALAGASFVYGWLSSSPRERKLQRRIGELEKTARE
jgi:hypothetical protein